MRAYRREDTKGKMDDGREGGREERGRDMEERVWEGEREGRRGTEEMDREGRGRKKEKTEGGRYRGRERMKGGGRGGRGDKEGEEGGVEGGVEEGEEEGEEGGVEGGVEEGEEGGVQGGWRKVRWKRVKEEMEKSNTTMQYKSAYISNNICTCKAVLYFFHSLHFQGRLASILSFFGVSIIRSLHYTLASFCRLAILLLLLLLLPFLGQHTPGKAAPTRGYTL